jgi:hypothetical protein
MTQAWLTAYGRIPWDRIYPELTGSTCAWADLDGFHHEHADTLDPDHPPVTTHIWAWTNQRLWRIRIDGAEGIAARLDLSTPEPDPQHPTERVDIVETLTPTWAERDFRVSVDHRWRGQTVNLYDVAGLMPLTFARLTMPLAPATTATQRDQ